MVNKLDLWTNPDGSEVQGEDLKKLPPKEQIWFAHPIYFIKHLDKAGLLGVSLRTDDWEIYSIGSGKVVLSYYSNDYGNTVIIEDYISHEYVRYGHLKSKAVDKDANVMAGEIIGIMGDTGRGDPVPNKHLHVSVYPATAKGIYTSGNVINPTDYIKNGIYPCNTYISTKYEFPISKGKGGTYLHEGIDFSGKEDNLIRRDNNLIKEIDWTKGISGEVGMGLMKNIVKMNEPI